jgi:hypothetical protein
MPEFGAIVVQNQIRRAFDVVIREARLADSDGTEIWVVEAVAKSGERWIARHASLLSACLMLAEAMGFDGALEGGTGHRG